MMLVRRRRRRAGAGGAADVAPALDRGRTDVGARTTRGGRRPGRLELRARLLRVLERRGLGIDRRPVALGDLDAHAARTAVVELGIGHVDAVLAHALREV